MRTTSARLRPNNGRLDLVINNIDAPAFIYENVAPPGSTSHYLQIRLNGEYPNRRGLGAKVVVTAGGIKQTIDHTPYRGYMSTVEDRIHFGLGTVDRVDSLEVFWPDGRYQLLTDVEADQLLAVHQSDASETRRYDPGARNRGNRIFRSAEVAPMPAYEHRVTAYQLDYALQPLLPYEVSKQGPPLAIADVTGNGLDDVFIGGSAGFPGRLFLQQEDGRYLKSTETQPWVEDRE